MSDGLRSAHIMTSFAGMSFPAFCCLMQVPQDADWRARYDAMTQNPALFLLRVTTEQRAALWDFGVGIVEASESALNARRQMLADRKAART